MKGQNVESGAVLKSYFYCPLAPAAEALFRLLAAEKLGVRIEPTLADVFAGDKAVSIKVRAA